MHWIMYPLIPLWVNSPNRVAPVLSESGDLLNMSNMASLGSYINFFTALPNGSLTKGGCRDNHRPCPPRSETDWPNGLDKVYPQIFTFIEREHRNFNY